MIEIISINILFFLTIYVVTQLDSKFTDDSAEHFHKFLFFMAYLSIFGTLSFFVSVYFKGFFDIFRLTALLILIIYISSQFFQVKIRSIFKSPSIIILYLQLTFLGIFFIWDGAEGYFKDATFRFFDGALDNFLPTMLAQYISAGSIPDPLVPGWQASDRPPLQTGIQLLILGMGPWSDQVNFGVSTSLQSLLIWAVYFLFRWLGLSGLQLLYSLTFVSLTGVVLQNYIFTWPKAIAGSMFLASIPTLYGLISDKSIQERKNTTSVIAGGVVVSGSLLAHGAQAFALIGFFALYLIFWIKMSGKAANFRTITFFFGAMSFLYIPWIVYQKLVNPPGDRLLKLHLAGEVGENSSSLTEILVHNYSNSTITEILANRLENVARSLTPFIDPKLGNLGTNGIYATSDHSRTVAWPIPLENVDARLWSISETNILISAISWILIPLILSGISKWRISAEEENKNFEVIGHNKSRFLLKLFVITWITWIALMYQGGEARIIHGPIILPLLILITFSYRFVRKLNSQGILLAFLLQLLVFSNIYARDPVSALMGYEFRPIGVVILIGGFLCLSLKMSIEYRRAGRSLLTK
jgi:hypothetical protein